MTKEHQSPQSGSNSGPNSGPSTRQTIVQLLSNMSDGKEIRTYLQRFASLDKTRFAIIKIGGAILRDKLEETAGALAFLHTVGLTPIVIHGGQPQLDAELERRGIKSEKVNGLRKTTPEVLDVARQVFVDENIKLVEAVRAHGVAAHSLTTGVIEADYLHQEQFGLVGEPTDVRNSIIDSTVKSGAIPILTCLGLAPGGQIVNVNADSVTRALVKALQPMKIVFLAGVGGLLDGEGKVIHSINLAADYENLMKADYVEGGMRLKLQEIAMLLDNAPLSSSVSITTPSALMRELFTHGGAGTLIRKGENIVHHQDKAELDRERSISLINDAFGKTLKPGWFEKYNLKAAYISENYRAAAFLSMPDDFVYLDKFAVLEDARGEGLARTVWRRFVADYPIVFWRSRTANGFNAFYDSEADGCVKRGPWTIYWKGEDDFGRIESIVDEIMLMPPSFEGDEG